MFFFQFTLDLNDKYTKLNKNENPICIMDKWSKKKHEILLKTILMCFFSVAKYF